MFHLISGLCFFQSGWMHIRFFMAFLGLLVAAHAARSEEDASAHDLDILAIQVERSDVDQLLPYQINATVVLERAKDIGRAGPEFSGTAQIYLVAESKKDVAWEEKSHWELAPAGGSAGLSPLLRFESKGERIEIKPRFHSIWFIWRKALDF
ncbi:MAG: hypothetical protein HYZ46_03335 [Nitrosomonadales bacterium]|nr:hypothetical protein [Nitrosomonadales bacterium]